MVEAAVPAIVHSFVEQLGCTWQGCEPVTQVVRETWDRTGSTSVAVNRVGCICCGDSLTGVQLGTESVGSIPEQYKHAQPETSGLPPGRRW